MIVIPDTQELSSLSESLDRDPLFQNALLITSCLEYMSYCTNKIFFHVLKAKYIKYALIVYMLIYKMCKYNGFP